jgi:iron complex outermembrane receptor protein
MTEVGPGSMIKRTDTETPSPVQIVTAADLQQSGYTTRAP